MEYREPGTRGPGFSVTVLQLVEGYVGQVQFEYEIVYQTEVMPDGESARAAARDATVEAVRRLFK